MRSLTPATVSRSRWGLLADMRESLHWCMILLSSLQLLGLFRRIRIPMIMQRASCRPCFWENTSPHSRNHCCTTAKRITCKFILFKTALFRLVDPLLRVTILLGVATTVTYVHPMHSVNPCTLAILHFVLIHTMSCYVYRNVRLGVYRSCSVSSSFIDRQLHAPVAQQRFEVAEVVGDVAEKSRWGSRSLSSIAERVHTDPVDRTSSDSERDVEKRGV